MAILCRFLFRVVIIPSLVFMIFAAIADGLAWMLEAILDDLENEGWPERASKKHNPSILKANSLCF